MKQNPLTVGFGGRLSEYRRLAGLSAQELSDRLGGSLSRAVIANIESGRKTDITIDQLLEISWALGVPPVALALPIDRPFETILISQDQEIPQSMWISDVMDWMTSTPAAFQRDRTPVASPAGVVARNRIRVIREIDDVRGELYRLRAAPDDDYHYQEMVQQRLDELDALNTEAESLGLRFGLHIPTNDRWR